MLATEDIAVLVREGPFDGMFSEFRGTELRAGPFGGGSRFGEASGAREPEPCCAWPDAQWPGKLSGTWQRETLERRCGDFERGGTVGRLVEGVTVEVHYPSARAMARLFAPDFRLLQLKGIGVTVPPSYLEPLAQRFPGVLKSLAAVDRLLGSLPCFAPWRIIFSWNFGGSTRIDSRASALGMIYPNWAGERWTSTGVLSVSLGGPGEGRSWRSHDRALQP